MRIIRGLHNSMKLVCIVLYSFLKNDWIVYVCWYNFVPSKQNRTKDRFYSRGSVQWIPCNSIIRCLTMPIALTWSSRHYKLSESLHIHIEENGDISYSCVYNRMILTIEDWKTYMSIIKWCGVLKNEDKMIKWWHFLLRFSHPAMVKIVQTSKH